MKKYIRTKDGRIYELISDLNGKSHNVKVKVGLSYGFVSKATITDQADDIDDLIRIGDIVKHYDPCAKRYEYFYIHDKNELEFVKFYLIVALLASDGYGGFNLVAVVQDEEAMIKKVPLAREKLELRF